MIYLHEAYKIYCTQVNIFLQYYKIVFLNILSVLKWTYSCNYKVFYKSIFYLKIY